MHRLFIGAILVAGSIGLAAPSWAQIARTPNLCDSLAKDLSSRFAVQLLSGAPRTTDRAPDPLVGRFATAVQLYGSLQCPMTPLADMLECLQVAMIEVDGDMRAMISRRQQCEEIYRATITGVE